VKKKIAELDKLILEVGELEKRFPTMSYLRETFESRRAELTSKIGTARR